MKPSTPGLKVQDLEHYGIIAGIVDSVGLVEQINTMVGIHHHQILTPSLTVKAMIINGLGMVSAPLYLFVSFLVLLVANIICFLNLPAECGLDDNFWL